MPVNPLYSGLTPTQTPEQSEESMRRLFGIGMTPAYTPQQLVQVADAMKSSGVDVPQTYVATPAQAPAAAALSAKMMAGAPAPSTPMPVRSKPMPADFEAKQRQIYKEVTGQDFKKGGAVKAKAKPAVKAKPASKVSRNQRGDGLAQRGKTKGRFI
jgi:hypothetical protein